MKRKRRSQKGLSLPEVLIASIIALVGMGSLLTTYTTGRFVNTAAQHYNQAMSLARARAEYLKSMLYRDLAAMPLSPDVTTESGLALDFRVDSGNFVPCTRITELIQETDGIEITVKVTWQERSAGSGSRTLTYQVKTWVCAPGKPT